VSWGGVEDVQEQERGARQVPEPVKALENQTGHRTEAEKAARAAAETEIIPDRGGAVTLEKPAVMSGNAAAARYWKKVLARMEGLSLLDDLDSDMLGVYCSMMARYEQQTKLLKKVNTTLKKAGSDPEGIAEAVSKLDTISSRLQSLERNILQYAEKLGLTPSGRVRLAQKRAAQVEVDPDAYLYGD